MTSHWGKHLNHAITLLTELIRENFRSSKLKQCLLPTLGQLIYLVATQEERVVNHMAAKIIENVCPTFSAQAQGFITGEVGPVLWHLFRHSTVDSLRITAISALCRITRQSPTAFQNVIEKVGLNAVIGSLASAICKVQQYMLTLFAAMLSCGIHLQRLIQEKDSGVIQRVQDSGVIRRVQDSGVIQRVQDSGVIRRVQDFGVIQRVQDSGVIRRVQGSGVIRRVQDSGVIQRVQDSGVIQRVQDSGVIQRDSDVIQRVQDSGVIRRVQDSVHDRWVDLSIMSPQDFVSTIIRLLDSPSTAIRAKAVLVLLYILIYNRDMLLLSCQARLVMYIERDSRKTSPGKELQGGSEYLASTDASCSLVSCCLHRLTECLTHAGRVLPVCAGPRGWHVTTCPFLTLGAYAGRRPSHFWWFFPRYEHILMEPDPVPAYALKLLVAMTEHNAAFTRLVEESKLVPLIFEVILEHQDSILGNTMQSVIALLNNLVAYKGSNMQLLYKQGLVGHVCNMFTVTATLCLDWGNKNSIEPAATLLASLLDILLGMLTHTSRVVRQALQAQKSGSRGDTQAAEDLLLLSKPLTNLISLLIPLLPSEDPEISEASSKCLSILVQLYGGENPDSLSPENLETFANLLVTKEDPKDQKLLLRILRRMACGVTFSLLLLQGGGVDLLCAVAAYHQPVGGLRPSDEAAGYSAERLMRLPTTLRASDEAADYSVRAGGAVRG
ncbi:Serine/threonine-protein kinase ULK4 [Microtus ochrogaster]|uniref:Serine/threonine-protein kinase ULK4 n=1 Tax=Microtus ochrogaster TaxID=79684 RepID=A0A8J6G1L4_MICOH|nr:Serine/threonine-protein kinase ULK4 [Microtus ochrogaster]